MATRREKVILSLQDDFSSGMARAAASAALLDRELSSVSGSHVDRDIDRIGTSARRADQGINQLSGRLRLMADTAVVLGPALAPIGALAVPAVAGLASQLGAAAVAGGTALVAFQGVGDALESVNKAALEPTAENLAAAREAMENISPAAQAFVSQIQDMRPALRDVRDAAAGGLFPGVVEGLDELESRLPDVERVFSSIGQTVGDLFSQGASSLSGPAFDDFFDFLATDVRVNLVQLGKSVGNVTQGLAELWQAFDPLNDSFGNWLVDVTRGFNDWAAGLDQTQGFQEFVQYIRTNGPQVAETMKSLGNAVLQIAEAAAPLGGPVLKGIEAFADAISAIADSDIGTPLFTAVAAMTALNRAAMLFNRTTAGAGMFAGLTGGTKAATGGLKAIKSDLADMSDGMVAFGANAEKAGAASERMKSRLAGIGKSAGLVGGLAVASSGLADGFALTNTASLALMGTMAGPWGAAIGAGIGLLMDMSKANDQVTESLDALGQQMSQSSDFGQMTDILGQAGDELDNFKKSLDSSGFLDLGSQLASAKNTIEGIFGKSDVEEATAQYNEISDAMFQTENNARRLAVEMGAAFSSTTLENPDWLPTVEGMDNSITRLTVSTKDMQAAMESAAPAMANLGITKPFKDLNADEIRQVADEIGRMDSQAGRVDAIGDAFSGLDSQFISTAQSAQQLSSALEALFSPKLGAAAALDQWNLSLLQFDENLAANSRSLNQNTEAGIQNRSAIRGVTQNLLGLLSAQAENGAGAKKLARTFRDGRQAIIQQGVAAGFTRKQMTHLLKAYGLTPDVVETVLRAVGIDETDAKVARLTAKLKEYGLTRAEATAAVKDIASGKIHSIQQLANKYGMTKAQAVAFLKDLASGDIIKLLNKLVELDQQKPRPDVELVGAGAAIGAAHGVAGALNGIPRAVTSTVTVVTNHVTNTIHNIRRNLLNWADGGTIPAAASGMTVPGQRQPYGDKVLSYLAPGEEVISNRFGQADRWRGLLKAINANALADGGTVDGIQALANGGTSRGRVGIGNAGVGDAANYAAMSLKRLRKEVDETREDLKGIRQRRKQLASDVRSKLRSDLFGEVNPWDSGSPIDGIMGILQGDIREGRAFTRDARQLRRKGLTGAALQAVLQGADPTQVAAMSELSRGQLRRFERAYNVRQRVTRQAGSAAGNQVYAKALKAELRELRQIKRAIHQGNKDRRKNPGKAHRRVRDDARRGQRNRRRR